MWYYWFWIIRCLDIFTTWINFQLTGQDVSVEANPLSRYLLTHLEFPGFTMVNLFLSWFIFVLLTEGEYKRNIRDFILMGFVTLNSLVVLSNFIIFLISLHIIQAP